MSVKTTPAATVRPRFDGERFTPWPLVLFLAAAAGALYMLGFPPYGLWFLLPLALGLLNIAAFTRHWLTAGLSGVIAGLAAFVPLFEWANIYAGLTPWLALALLESLFFGAYAIVVRLIYVRHGIGFWSALGAAFVWAAIELARSTLPWGGLPWAISAFAYESSPLLNFGPWVGTVGLGVVTGLLGAYVFSVLMALGVRRRRGRNGVMAVWPSAVIVAIVLAAVLTPRPSNEVPAHQQSLAIAAVQGNVEPPPPGSYYLPEAMFANHAAETERFVATNPSARLIVWPEDSTGWALPDDPARLAVLERLSREAGAPLLVGGQVPYGAGERLNKSFLVSDEGLTGQEYAKQHPVPFGEYIPARDFFSRLTDKTDLVSVDMAAGTEVGDIRVDDVQVGVLICFEIAYEDLVRSSVQEGSEVIVVQSNNALFGSSHEAIQQLAQARVFSVISGRSIVHVSTVGHSAIFTPEGRVLDSLDHWTAGTMSADVPLRSGITPAMRYGELISLITVVIAVAALARAVATRARMDDERRRP